LLDRAGSMRGVDGGPELRFKVPQGDDQERAEPQAGSMTLMRASLCQ
jgi:hypothetical protein